MAAKPKGGLTAWFGKGSKGDWVDIGAPKRKVSFKPVVGNLLKQVSENTPSVYHEPKLKP